MSYTENGLLPTACNSRYIACNSRGHSRPPCPLRDTVASPSQDLPGFNLVTTMHVTMLLFYGY